MPIPLTILHDKNACSVTVDQTTSLEEVLKDIVFCHLELQGDPLDYCLRFADTEEYIDLDVRSTSSHPPSSSSGTRETSADDECRGCDAR